MRGKFAGFWIVFFLLAVSALCVLLNRPPASVPASAPAADFSAERAMVHEFAMAQKPHPLGSAEHDRVRDYIVAELARLGLAPQIQRTTGVTERYQAAGSVENIVARLAGTSGHSDAVLLAAHYDSVAAGPGAGDDGAGVAALLEALRALRAGPPLPNDVIFLFTDGEEDGLLGASAFLAEHPWARDVRVALNFEARGNAGVSQMFETSTGNGALIAALAQAAPHPSGSSLTYEIYKHMPNDTDMTVFKKGGAAGLNFAFIGHWEAYHTPLDNPQQLDRGSLQQHGEAALSLARYFGNANLSQLQGRDAVYFTFPGGFFIHYPGTLVWRFAGFGLLLLLATALFAGGAGETTAVKLSLGFLTNLGMTLLVSFCGFGSVKLLTWLHLHRLPEGDIVQNSFYLLSLCAVLTALWAIFYRLLRRKLPGGSLLLGGALQLFLLALVTAKWMPGGSYVFLWALICLLLGTFLVCGARLESPSLVLVAALVALAIPVLLLFVPLVHGFYQALGLSPIGGAALGSVLALLCMALAPVIALFDAAHRSFLPLAALALGALCFFGGAATTHYSSEHPKPSLLAYALDLDAGQALWASSARRLDPWTMQYLGTSPKRGKLSGFYPAWLPLDFLLHEAPVLPLPAPEVQLAQSIVTNDARTVVLRISSRRHARVISLSAPENEILESWVNGKKLGDPKQARWNSAGKWTLSYANVPAEGIELKLVVKGKEVLKVRAVDRTTGLPEIPGKVLPPRPADSMPYHSGDETLVRRTFVF